MGKKDCASVKGACPRGPYLTATSHQADRMSPPGCPLPKEGSPRPWGWPPHRKVSPDWHGLSCPHREPGHTPHAATGLKSHGSCPSQTGTRIQQVPTQRARRAGGLEAVLCGRTTDVQRMWPDRDGVPWGQQAAGRPSQAERTFSFLPALVERETV